MLWGAGTAIFDRVTSIKHNEKARSSQRLEGNRVNQQMAEERAIQREQSVPRPEVLSMEDMSEDQQGGQCGRHGLREGDSSRSQTDKGLVSS